MNKRIIIAFALIWTASTFAYGQTEQDRYARFVEAMMKANKLQSSERLYRRTTQLNELENGIIVKSVAVIHERAPLDSERFLIIEKAGGIETRSEYIRTGGVNFTRANDEPWIQINTRKYLPRIGKDDSVTGYFECNRQFTEDAPIINGVPFQKFRGFRVQSKLAKQTDCTLFEDTSWWFDQSSGERLKVETLKGSLEPRGERTHSLTTYEYNPKNLKIEAPMKIAPRTYF